MTPEAHFTGTWNNGRNNIQVDVPLIIFEEDGSKIVYCPPLDISGYGNTEEEAVESFKICLGEFLNYTLNKKTFYSEMKRLGWKVKEKSHKPMTPPPMSMLLDSNDNFSRIFNNFPFRKINESILLPV